MDLRRVKRWQWAIAGTIAGLALGATSVLRGNDELIGGEGFISQREFEQVVTRAAWARPSPVVSLTLRRASHVDLITLNLANKGFFAGPVRYAAARPYKPRGQQEPSSQNYSVQDFLSPLAAQNPALHARYPWWEEAKWKFTFWTTGTAAFVTFLWPTILVLLLGKLPPEPPPIKLTPPPESEPKKRELTAEELKHLEELEAEMMAGIASTTAPSEEHAATAAAEPAAVKQLTTEAVQPLGPAVPDNRQYAGEYYPVAKKPPHGFSLVEILVVIAIITILISLLLAAIVSAQRQAEQTRCASNLRQIGYALQMYSAANQGMLPAWSGWHTWPQDFNHQGGAWTVELIPYIGAKPDSVVYNCPSFRSRVKCRNYFLAAQWAGKSNRHSMKLTDVTLTGRFVLSGDKTQRSLYPAPFGNNSTNSDDSDPDDYGGASENPVLAWPWDPGGFYMHRNGNNVLFDDLHVAIFDRYDPINMTFNPHRIQDWFDVTGDPTPQ